MKVVLNTITLTPYLISTSSFMCIKIVMLRNQIIWYMIGQALSSRDVSIYRACGCVPPPLVFFTKHVAFNFFRIPLHVIVAIPQLAGTPYQGSSNFIPLS